MVQLIELAWIKASEQLPCPRLLKTLSCQRTGALPSQQPTGTSERKGSATGSAPVNKHQNLETAREPAAPAQHAQTGRVTARVRKRGLLLETCS